MLLYCGRMPFVRRNPHDNGNDNATITVMRAVGGRTRAAGVRAGHGRETVRGEGGHSFGRCTAKQYLVRCPFYYIARIGGTFAFPTSVSRRILPTVDRPPRRTLGAPGTRPSVRPSVRGRRAAARPAFTASRYNAYSVVSAAAGYLYMYIYSRSSNNTA